MSKILQDILLSAVNIANLVLNFADSYARLRTRR